MKYRMLGKTGFEVSEISLGTWQVGGKWGSPFSRKNAEGIILEAIDRGVNFIDTADVYSDGLSEAAVARVVKRTRGKVWIATKCGRKIHPHVSSGYTVKALRLFVEDSLRNMKYDTLDLVQLHCPPTEVYYRPEIFELFDRLKDEGKILNLGVSVEKVEEGLKAIEYPNVATVQIIFNMFRTRPSDLFFREARKKNVGIIVRVPLASGLLTGKFTRETTFDPQDHRNFNRDGAGFDKGETFSGIPFETGLVAVEKLKKIFPDAENLAAVALRWILMFPEVGCVIPGASKKEQIVSNIASADLPALSQKEMVEVGAVYAQMVKPHVHQLW
jgi:aryl-alcohol dehydrogenase-like predicted oxidoreductase